MINVVALASGKKTLKVLADQIVEFQPTLVAVPDSEAKKELEELTRKQTQASRELEEHLTDVYRHFFSISGSETVVPQLQEELLLIGPYQAFILTGSVENKQYKLLFLGEQHSDIPKNEKGMLIWNFFKKVDEQRGMNLFVESPLASLRSAEVALADYALAIARSFASESSPVSFTRAVNFESGF